MDKAKESVFQQDIVDSLTDNTWLEGTAEHYDRELALYPEDLLAYVHEYPARGHREATPSSTTTRRISMIIKRRRSNRWISTVP